MLLWYKQSRRTIQIFREDNMHSNKAVDLMIVIFAITVMNGSNNGTVIGFKWKSKRWSIHRNEYEDTQKNGFTTKPADIFNSILFEHEDDLKNDNLTRIITTIPTGELHETKCDQRNMIIIQGHEPLPLNIQRSILCQYQEFRDHLHREKRTKHPLPVYTVIEEVIREEDPFKDYKLVTLYSN
jgi:hypothetical protein